MHRHGLVPHVVDEVADTEPLVGPLIQPFTARQYITGRVGHQADSFETNISAPTSLTTYFSSGRGGGPETLPPLRSYVPLWQAHQSSFMSGRYCTVQSRCVQTAETALSSPDGVSTIMPS